jgi:hypothetical protein
MKIIQLVQKAYTQHKQQVQIKTIQRFAMVENSLELLPSGIFFQ